MKYLILITVAITAFSCNKASQITTPSPTPTTWIIGHWTGTYQVDTVYVNGKITQVYNSNDFQGMTITSETSGVGLNNAPITYSLANLTMVYGQTWKIVKISDTKLALRYTHMNGNDQGQEWGYDKK